MIGSQEVTAAVLLPAAILGTVCQAVNLGRMWTLYREDQPFGNKFVEEQRRRAVQWSAVALLMMLAGTYVLLVIMLSNRVPT